MCSCSNWGKKGQKKQPAVLLSVKPIEEQEADVTASVSIVLIQTGLVLCHAINGIQKIKQLCSVVLIQLKSCFPK